MPSDGGAGTCHVDGVRRVRIGKTNKIYEGTSNWSSRIGIKKYTPPVVHHIEKQKITHVATHVVLVLVSIF